MPTVTVGLMAPGNSTNYKVTFSPVIGNVGMNPGSDTGITWTMAGTTGAITAPAGASIAAISIGQGVATFDWAGGAPQNNDGVWTVPNNVPNPTTPPFTFGYVVTVSYNGNPYSSSDPEIVNEAPVGDPDIVRSAPGD